MNSEKALREALERLSEAAERDTRGKTHDGSDQGTSHWFVRVRYDDLTTVYEALAKQSPAPAEREGEKRQAAEALVRNLIAWADHCAGEGIGYAHGALTPDPDDMLMQAADAFGTEEWETLADLTIDSLSAREGE